MNDEAKTYFRNSLVKLRQFDIIESAVIQRLLLLELPMSKVSLTDLLSRDRPHSWMILSSPDNLLQTVDVFQVPSHQINTQENKQGDELRK